jgi:hypothetical protein
LVACVAALVCFGLRVAAIYGRWRLPIARGS